MTLVIVQAAGLVTIQDLGRPGHMHLGLASGGALVRGMLVEANRAVGNADDAAAIEVLGKLVVRAERSIVTSHGFVQSGDVLTLESEPMRVAYLAIRGGVDAPLVFGSCATQLSAGIGALLHAGTYIDVAAAALTGRTPDVFELDRDAPMRVIAGPDSDAFMLDALDVLVAQPYRVLPTSDRVGTRLAGAKLARVAKYRDRSRPMVRGAIEVPQDGQPIVLGPEHPTTGGYPIVGVVAHDDFDRLFAIRAGDVVRFHTSE